MGYRSARRRQGPQFSRTFVSLTGPEGNIGDALIRREQLRWAHDTSDELVVYTGISPTVWLRQVGVPTGARVLRGKSSVRAWLWMLACAPRHPVLVFEAGEVPLDRGNVLRELVFLAETVIVRLKRGIIVRPPRGIRAPTQPATWLHARAARLSQFPLWRDAASAQLAGGDRVVPDIGFAAGIRAGRPWAERDELIVSLRGARRVPDENWLAAVRSLAAEQGLRIRTVVQVREDEGRAGELAEALGGSFEPWGQTDALAHEELLRERYEGARLVISDRMHVLVLAALSGAAPAELVPAPTGKIARAFEAAGIRNVTMDADGVDDSRMQAFLRARLGAVAEVRAGVEAAERSLAELEAEIRASIRAARA